MSEPRILQIRTGEGRESGPGIRIWTVSGTRMTMNYVELQPGAVTRLDRHENEQLNYVLSGRVEALLGAEGETRQVLAAGGMVVIPGDVPHRFRVDGEEPASFLGIISPAREPRALA
ncbi:MAG: cupin domain-containing protein [Gemmatimonadota bacterium]